ncbi:MAG: 50S ribosomal protein L4 [Candidatus Lightella neohaematopini]|nr:50S ribosomal protein L4 [Candidatus Lightella neohaematopini]
MKVILSDIKEYIDVLDCVFNYKFNLDLINQSLFYYLNSIHKGTKSQKNRSEVSGSGKKPWRQKGTGRARAGSIRSPIWRSGGVSFATNSKNLGIIKINKKMYKGAIKSILSELLRKKRLVVLKNFVVNSFKTKDLSKKLHSICSGKILIIVNKLDRNLLLSSSNLSRVNAIDVTQINPVSLMKADNIIITIDAIRKIEEKYL